MLTPTPPLLRWVIVYAAELPVWMVARALLGGVIHQLTRGGLPLLMVDLEPSIVYWRRSSDWRLHFAAHLTQMPSDAKEMPFAEFAQALSPSSLLGEDVRRAMAEAASVDEN